MYKNPEVLQNYTEHAIKEEMNQWGEGARAEIYVFNGKTAFGHAFMAEIRMGHVVYIDPQSGQLLTSEIFNDTWTSLTKFFRTDTLQFNDEVLECIKNRKTNDKRRSN